MKAKQRPPFIHPRGLLWMMLMMLYSFPTIAQTKLSGKIVDEEGRGLPGVTILAKGTAAGTVTDLEGQYTFSVPEGTKYITVSFIGYSTQNIPIDNRSIINTAMEVDAETLEEVVVVGYGTVLKRDLTGSVASLKTEEIRQIPAQNPLESIQGKVAGVDITRSNGSASSGINITIRGNRSIGSEERNTPLFIVDGVQTVSIGDINPNSIASMEILKDASATAIYGWQGANGVVIITTKKGKRGKTNVTFNSYYGISDVSRYPSVLDGPGYVALKREANRTTGSWNSPADDPVIFNDQELEAIQNNDWIDYQDLLLSNGSQQNYNVGVTTGSDKTRVFFSLDYFKEKGILKFDKTNRYSLRSNVDHSFNNWIKAGLQSQITNRDESYRRDPLNMANKIIPLGRLYDDDGEFILFPAGGNSISPLADEQPDVFSNTGKKTNVIASVYLELKPFTGFTFRTNFGGNIENSRIGLFEGQNSISRATATGSLASYSSTNSRFFNWDNVVTYSKEINNHSFTLTALSSYVESVSENVYARGDGQLLPGQLFYALGNAPDNITINSDYAKWNVLSFAGRFNYSYKGRYLITLTNRADGASRLSKGNKWASFPSVAAAWRISDENFMTATPINELKLRFSYGVAGNSAIPPYGTQSTLTRVPMAFGETSFQGFTFSPILGNEDTGWELSKTKNLGVDVGLWQDKLNATIDIYDTKTSDLLLPRGLAPTTGVQTVYQNIGETRNRGIEVALTSNNIRTNSFSWSSTITFTHNKEEIVSLVTKGVDDIGNGWFIGHPTKVFYDYEKLGIWQTSETDEAALFGQEPGDIKVKDQNNDGSIDAINDRKVLGGNNIPKWYGGFNNKITYKAFDLNIYIFARWGQTLNPNFLRRYDRQSNLSNSGTVINYWTPENPSNDYPRPNANTSGASTLYWSTLGYVDGSYLKVRNVSLGYTFSNLKNPILDNVRIYFTGTNLLTYTKSSKLKEYDPERGGGESAPMLKNYILGVNVSF